MIYGGDSRILFREYSARNIVKADGREFIATTSSLAEGQRES